MNIPGFLFLLLIHFICGRALLALLRIKEKPVVIICLSMICGVLLASFVPLLTSFASVPVTATNMAIALIALAIAMNVAAIKKYDYSIFKNRINFKFHFRLYEWLFAAVFIYIMLTSVWRCFYLPPYARDMLSGPEALAEYAVKENTFINSIFTVDLSSTNNHLKPPFVANLQILYKLFVQPFGQLWLSVIAVSFLVWLYALLKERLHPFLACVLVLLFITMPDPYAYTYLILFDYSNMVLFFAGYLYLTRFLNSHNYNQFLFSAILFAFACFIRLDTLVLMGLMLPFLAFRFWKTGIKPPKIALRLLVFMLGSLVVYYVWTGLFIQYYFPVHFAVTEQINQDLLHTTPVFFSRLWGILSRFFYNAYGIELFGWIICLFTLVFVIDLVLIRKFTYEGKLMLLGILLLLIGLPLLGYLIPLFDFDNTTKRGVYKILPLMLLYMANSGLLRKWSDVITAWEKKAPVTAKLNK
jgi:uncharacterized membrane protein YidH (DUF202 family)